MNRQEAINIVKKNWPDSSFTSLKEALGFLIPELAEPEDERIRKALIYHYQGDGCICNNEYRIDYKDIRAWLEKQGEQTSLNNIWHRANETPQIKSDDRSVAVLLCCYRIFDVKPVESWEVAHYYHEYGFLNFGQTIKENDVIRWAYLDELIEKQGKQKPAYTKEYYFHGMKFVPKFAKGDIIKDKKRSEVSIIKDFSYDTGLYTHTYGQFPITIQDNYEIIEQKSADKVEPNPAWSEEDENFFKTALWHISYSISKGKSTDFQCDTTEWFKSLKDRVIPQPKQEWSEEDEKMINDIIMCGEHHCYLDARNIAWLKSFKDRYTWKPSDEQLK